MDSNGDGRATWRWGSGAILQLGLTALFTIALAYVMLYMGAYPEDQPDKQPHFWLMFTFFHVAGGLQLLWVLYNVTGRTELHVNAEGILVRHRPISFPLPRFYPSSDIVRVAYAHRVDIVETNAQRTRSSRSGGVRIPAGKLSIYTISGEVVVVGKRIRSAEAGELLADFIRDYIPEKTTVMQDPGYAVAVNQGTLEHSHGCTRWVQPWRGQLFLPFFLGLLLFGLILVSVGVAVLASSGTAALAGAMFVTCMAIPMLGGAYWFGALALNRTTIEVQPRGLNVRHHPMPWPGTGFYSLATIAALQLQPHTMIINNVPQTTYNILLMTRHGKQVKLARRLDAEQDARSMMELIAKGIWLPTSALQMPGEPVMVPELRRSTGLKHVTRIRRLPRPRPIVQPSARTKSPPPK